jgi:transposase
VGERLAVFQVECQKLAIPAQSVKKFMGRGLNQSLAHAGFNEIRRKIEYKS